MTDSTDFSTTNSLLSALHRYAIHTPNNIFLSENRQAELSFCDTYLLTTQLIPLRLLLLCPSLATHDRRKNVILLCPNNSLFPLSMFALWTLSATVVPISVSADPSLWAGMVDLVTPDTIFVSSFLKDKLTHCLDEAPISRRPQNIIELEFLIPPEFLSYSTDRASDFIPSCHKWLSSHLSIRETTKSAYSLPLDFGRDNAAVTMFTSSAVDWSSLKCVTYTHQMLLQSSIRAIAMLGGVGYSSQPKRHLGWLPLSHCFEFCISFCGIVMGTGGSYVFYDPSVSSPMLPESTPLATLLLAGLEYHANATSFCAIPAVVHQISQQCTASGLQRLQELHSLGVGGAPTPPHLFGWAINNDISYFDCSGATEAVGTICIRRALDPRQSQYGLQVISGLMGSLEKSQMTNNFGELIISGTHLPTGYDGRESNAFHYDPASGITTYRTGDLYSHQESVSVLSYLEGEPVPAYSSAHEPMSGLSYLGRTDDMVVFATGLKTNVLPLEKRLNENSFICRSAIIYDARKDALLVLVQPQVKDPSSLNAAVVLDAVMEINSSLPFGKRLLHENILVVKDLPVTTKLTLNRKRVKKVVSSLITNSQILGAFGPFWETRPNSESTTLSPNIRERVVSLLSRIFHVRESHFDESSDTFLNLPLTSLSSVQLARALQDQFSLNITAAQLFGIHSVNDLCSLIAQNTRVIESTSPPSKGVPELTSTITEDLVFTGATCRFCGGIDSLDTLWFSLLSPDTFVKQLPRQHPSSRWTDDHLNEEDISRMGWLDDSIIDVISLSEFFGIPPTEVEYMSPNSRLVLKLGYEAIEDAGIAPTSLGGKPWGIFTALNDSGWRERRAQESPSTREYAKGLEGSADDAAGARLSYFLNLTGPAIEIKTACSSSAVAIHQACTAIRNGDCEAAVVIASTTFFHPASALFRSITGISSRSGHCSPFSDSADGFVPSEGAAAVVIQKASDTTIQPYGCLKASAVTQDGRSRGFFAPNPQAQKRLLRTAIDRAGCPSKDIFFVEAHGTGTRIGDTIEIEAINEVFGPSRDGPLYLGSVKGVIGHTEECSGLAGLLKAILCIKNEAIPPQPRLGIPNEAIDMEAPKLIVPQKLTPFPVGATPRLVGISSFGLSGTLAHLILEEFPWKTRLPATSPKARQLFLLTARSRADFVGSLQQYFEHFRNQNIQERSFEAVCRTTQIGRDHFRVRRAWVVDGWRALMTVLQQASMHPPPVHNTPPRPKIGLWFGLPLVDADLGQNDHPLYNSMLSQSAQGWATENEYFLKQLVIAKCLVSFGCDVTVVGGEGLSEYVGAVFGEVMPSTAVFRAINVQAQEGQKACVIRCKRDRLDELLMEWKYNELHLTGEHGSELFTVQGDTGAIMELSLKDCVEVQRIDDLLISRAYTLDHTIPLSRSHTQLISGHLGEVLPPSLTTNVTYWEGVHNRPVQSVEAWKTLAAACDVVINISDTRDIEHFLGDQCISFHQSSMLAVLGHLFEKGCTLNWPLIAPPGDMAHIPTYHWATDVQWKLFRQEEQEEQ
ncbi:polyketide synthetase [Collybia nuda]|uniref:Polyketide synthetase n=1 Tax=Collybia nuda TaxID=64659 RepID=A0A9P5Y608_9AGAR|nr:polyketide synthetase [Collybia nuda]